jgi:hypothetical protein
MPKYSKIESVSDYFGVNTDPIIPSRQMRASMSARAVNRSALRNMNETRPPYIGINCLFQNDADEYTFRNAAITGMKFYQGEGSLFSSFLIVCVGDLIMAGYMKPNSIEFFTIYRGIDPQWTFSYMCQALNILAWQNDKDLPLYWTGNPQQPMKLVKDSAYIKNDRPMMIGNLMTFAHGRIFLATNNNLVYASDFILSQGFALEQREAVLSFSESFYPSSGDGFGAPSEMGPISGLIAIPQSDTLNGHGDVMVTCRNGIFSIAPNRKVRNQWTDDPEMQKSVMLGKGCSAHESIIPFANQIFYRDSNGGISSMLNDISSYQSRQPLDEISRQVREYTDYDLNTPDIQFSNACITNNRLLMSVAHQREQSSHMGIHRFGMGMVSACLQSRNGKLTLAWEGLWTGPRVVATAQSNLSNNRQTIVASYDTDKQNRLYYIDESAIRSEDYVRNKYQPVQSFFTMGGVFFNDTQNEPITKSKIGKAEILLVKSNATSVTSSFSTNGDKEQYPLDFQLTEIAGCALGSMRALSSDVCNTKSGTKQTTASIGYYFDVTFHITGQARIAKISVGGNPEDQEGFNGDLKCENLKDTTTLSCPLASCIGVIENFNYQF